MKQASLNLIRYGILLLCVFSFDVFAQVQSDNVLDGVVIAYRDQAAMWVAVIENAASWLFWLLVSISMIWTFGFMALKKADIGEFFAEFIRFTIFTGFFWWLLTNGAAFAGDIIASMRQLGSDAAGLPQQLFPSTIVDIGFDIVGRVLDMMSVWSPIDSAVAIVCGLVILVVLALIGVNMVLLLISAWFLAFAGIFFLGFGGSRWTSDIAINYFKTVLGLAVQIMAMILLVGIGENIITGYQNNLSGSVEIVELAVILVVSITLLLLTNKVPSLLSGIISGSSVGGQGIGNFGAGAAVGATAALATAGAAMAAGVSSVATSTAGGGSAIMAAYKSAMAEIGAGSSMGSASGGIDSAVSSANAGMQDYNSSASDGESSLNIAMGGGTSEGTITDGSALGGGESASTDTGTIDSESGASGSDGASGNEAASSSEGTSNTEAASSSEGTSNTEAASSSEGTSSTEAASSSEGTSNTEAASSSEGTSNTEAASSSEGTSGNSESQDQAQPGQDSQKPLSGMSKASAVASHMASSLARGMKSHATNQMNERMDKFKDSVSKTTGGQIASEIMNPNQRASDRENAKIVANAEKQAASKELSDKASALKGQFESPSADEISDFVNKGNDK